MSITNCTTCGSSVRWRWEEAFDKFGFGDGDGLIMTDAVADALRGHGYKITFHAWGVHNVVISEIVRNRRSLIPTSTRIGYDDPRQYLPKRLIKLLDEAFPDDQEVQP